jgi:septum formation protein
MKLVLGSTSPFRKALLDRLGLPFEAAAPQADETQLAGECPEQLVCRLSEAKARSLAETFPDALIIGSDQVASIDGETLGKPGGPERAIKQLSRLSGRRVSFYTGLCLYNSGSDTARVLCEPFHVHFRELDAGQIARYVERERPYNCAGSFKSEGLGIALFERLEGDDPNALVGLPLIRLVTLLAIEGVEVL